MPFSAAFCPFCRSRAVQATRRQRFSTALAATCTICGAAGPLVQPRRGESPEQVAARALDSWTRLASTVPANDVSRPGRGVPA